ncbi:procathepsin L-like [Harmonia axyridis]|uniref:procathepsin L-like n=1 Tax=Harmonia axyridis TaxID=115357 RepID=UPI001E2778D3|nr:procathepsin L-like [Harmonia axyridis]XP_045477251.1 procathepsin L-like [Harmonia axyridis]
MKSILLCCTIFIISVQAKDVEKEWMEYQKKYDKNYESASEKDQRYSIFKENLKKIEENNVLFEKGKSSHMEGVNQFSDWNTTEFFHYLNKGFSMGDKIYGEYFKKSKDFQIPEHVDWRDRYAITSVKNQEMCGGSWAFSAVGAIECQLGMRGNILNLSEQNIIDCAANYGCRGGSVDQAFYYVSRTGIMTDYSYPFIGTEGSCRFSDSGIRISGIIKIPSGDEKALQEAIAVGGAVSVGIDATEKLQRYKGGILDDDLCRNDSMKHWVLIIGYGKEDNKDYYIIKNSWGEQWGEKGYFRLARNKNNQCAVATLASFPRL